MKKILKWLIVPVSILAVALVLTSCSSSNNKSTKTSQKQTTITIATDGATQPFTYHKGSGLTGYDVEVLRAVFKKLPDYKPKFVTTAFEGIVTGIDAGRYQIGANDYGWTQERSDKYLFSSPLSKSNNAVAVKKGFSKVSSLDDLAGKSTAGNPASNYSKTISDYNAVHPDNPIKITYDSTGTGGTRLMQVESGKIDFMLYDKISLDFLIKDQGFEDTLEVQDIQASSADPEHEGYEYYLFSKDGEGQELQGKVNEVLKELKSDGTLAKLSKKFFGGDFVPDSVMFK